MNNGKKEYRIMFTGVGRRVELIQAFRRAAQDMNCGLKIYGADMSKTAPALYYCNVRKMTYRMTDSNYIPQLLQFCREEKIDLLIPTIDTDLLILAENKAKFEEFGTRVLISAIDKIAICRDKNYTTDFFAECGLNSPVPVNAYENYQGGYPCFIKPKDGSSSINAFRVDSQEELRFYASKIFDYIVQPFIEGDEYTVDIMCGFSGEPLSIVPRKRLAVRSGEVLKTQITLDRKIIAECRKIVDAFRPCGPLTVQLIRQKETEDDYYIEMNPRFGGGAPLSMKAGANSAKSVIQMLMGEEVSHTDEEISDNQIYSRFDQSICVDSGNCDRGAVRAVIFDLDDTLYPEKDYVRSGFRTVAQELSEIDAAEEKMWTAFLAGKPAIDTVLDEAGIINPERKQSCLETYRNHMPEIHLYPEARELILKLKEDGIRVGIITDGRVKGQQNKLRALGLYELVDEIVITDELGGTQFRKPNDIAFRIMQQRWNVPFETMVYVGDNPEKDFTAPFHLGMQSIYFRNSEGLYSAKEWIPPVSFVTDRIEEICWGIKNYRGGAFCEEETGLIIVGAGGHGKVIADIAKTLNRYSQIAFLDDDAGKQVPGYKTLGPVSDAEKWKAGNEFVVAVGDCSIREKIQSYLEKLGCLMAILIHPGAVIAECVKMEPGTVVMGNAVVNPGCIFGKGIIVNTGSTVDHDCVIGDYVHIAPGSHLSGNVVLGAGSWVGTGCSVRNNVRICRNCFLGAGAVVVRDIMESGIYVGVPARRLEYDGGNA